MKQDIRADPHHRLVRLLLAFAGDARLESGSRRPWASATFVGATHRLCLAVAGRNAFRNAVELADRLPEVEFHIPGQIVADIQATNVEGDEESARLYVEALTIEDW